MLPPPPAVAIIAHRGASGYAPEHTFAAYDLAVQQGADYLEQDLQLTADGHLVVLHDDTLDRTTDGTGPVADQALAEIERLDAGSWFDPSFAGERVPTLDAVLTRYGHAQRYYIETKAPGAGMEERLVSLLRAHGLVDAGPHQVLIQSFSAASLRLVRELEPRLPLIQLAREPIADLAATAEYATGIGPARSLVTLDLVQAAHDHRLLVHPYTLNTIEDHRWAIELGVDGGFSNFPDRFRAVRDARNPTRCA